MQTQLQEVISYMPEPVLSPEMLVCKDLRKVYPTPKGEYVVLDDLQLSIRQGEFVSIIGHSGCGKSTLLTMMAGLNEISGGQILVDDDVVRDAGPDRAVVFQSPSLLPWLTALQNVMIGVKQVFPGASQAEKEDICKYYLDKVGLGNDFYKRATDLSQGMQQRVGIARAFALKPKVLLLDEPFGMLDSLTRGELQDVLLEIWQKEQITAVAITHDVDESIFLADRVIMMTSGPYAKIGDELVIPIERPRNRKDVLEHPDYYDYRGYLLNFLNH
ncbi:ABC transporter ATP-binding protein [Fulvivirga ulvae]|uniref:ABC transporter ATP-binding protein n=1 Tax=Fulvivirga ulvae TaxID=2904245 RepID=UPI001F472E86|nr:ABC transporter ATP-binding protein [Fulvivirga ulvae]UII34529.1 ABC transporter ATP-binding protein [Fulvivirga ulvae]